MAVICTSARSTALRRGTMPNSYHSCGTGTGGIARKVTRGKVANYQQYLRKRLVSYRSREGLGMFLVARHGAGLEVTVIGRQESIENDKRLRLETPQNLTLRRRMREEHRLKKSLKLGAKNDTLENLPKHWAVLAVAGVLDFALLTQGCGEIATKVMNGVGDMPLLAGFDAASAFVFGYLLADLGTGIFHWSVDNYGSGSTPIFGNVIAAFQGHHRQPWSITVRGAANNLAPLASPAIFALLFFLLLPVELGAMKVFLSSFILFVILSQHFHRLSHCKPSKVSPFVRSLQKHGILLSTSDHAAHHKIPFNSNYCIVNGLWNRPLDSIQFFPRLEKAVYFLTGVEPRCWNEDPDYEWIESQSYFENDEEDLVPTTSE